MEMSDITDEFSLDRTLSCGQCFRWRHEDGLWSGTARGRALNARCGDTALLAADPVWRGYFDLDFDYAAVAGELSRLSPVLAEAVAFSGGIHILNQEPWEAVCSFIISQNNNIPRIKGIIERLCTRYGSVCDFPRPEVLAAADEADLRALGCGFRAPYIIGAALAVSRGDVPLDELRGVPLNEARDALMTIRGVGPKVADCALLYGLHRLDAFPADVWIKRAMSDLFPGMTPDFFGEYAGIAQQYIFHYIRHSASNS